MTDLIAQLFASDDDDEKYYPGSKRKRREPPPKVVKDEEAWDASPILRTLKGREMEFFEIGALAAALGRPVVTIRRWEHKGYIPTAPFRATSSVMDGEKKYGNRLYSRALIETTVQMFSEQGLMGKPRLDWPSLTGFSIQLFEAWSRIHASEMQ